MDVRDDGFALLAVLWGSAIVSLLALAVLTTGYTQRAASGNDRARLRTSLALSAAANDAISRLCESVHGAREIENAPAYTFSFDGAHIAVRLQKEVGKVDVNYASMSTMSLAIDHLPLNQTEREKLRAAIRARRAAGPRQVFHSLPEWLQAAGLGQLPLRLLSDSFTVSSQHGEVDLRYASSSIRDAFGVGHQPPGDWVIQRGDAVMIEVSFSDAGGAPHSLTEIIRLSGSPSRPYWKEYWHQNG